MFPEIGRVKIFLSITSPLSPLPPHSRMGMRIYISFSKNNTLTHKQKAEETKEEKRISVENQMVYDDIVCKFAVWTCNLRNRVMSFYLLFISEAATKGVL